MKRIVISLLVLALISLGLFWSRNYRKPDEGNLAEFKLNLIRELQIQKSISLRVSFDHTRPEEPELIKPTNFLPSYETYNLTEVQAIYEYSKKCETKNYFKRSATLRKAWQWQDFICKKLRLPANFFETPPFLHPSGQSYSALAQAAGLYAPKKYFSWVENIGADPDLKNFFTKGDWASLVDFDQQNGLVFLKEYIFIKLESENLNYLYEVFSIEAASAFLQNKPYIFVPNAQKNKNLICLENSQSGCWALNRDFESATSQKYRLLAGLFLFLSSGLLTYLVVVGFLRQREIREDRNFVMRILAHELRTPITALSLEMESLRQVFGNLEADSQVVLMRVFNNVERLKKLVQSSEKYLIADSQVLRKDSQLKTVHLKQFVEAFVEKQSAQSVITELPDEAIVQANEYWLDLCLQNLLHNALSHGVQPVQIRLEILRQRVYLSVIDQGQVESDLSELTKAFVKAKNSDGLGLGLEIAKKAAMLSGARLELIAKPTTNFRLVWET